jgi:hypothetical protein
MVDQSSVISHQSSGAASLVSAVLLYEVPYLRTPTLRTATDMDTQLTFSPRNDRLSPAITAHTDEEAANERHEATIYPPHHPLQRLWNGARQVNNTLRILTRLHPRGAHCLGERREMTLRKRGFNVNFNALRLQVPSYPSLVATGASSFFAPFQIAPVHGVWTMPLNVCHSCRSHKLLANGVLPATVHGPPSSSSGHGKRSNQLTDG